MKKIHVVISLFTLALFSGCSKENNDVNLEAVTAPANVSALMTIKQDNSGEVTFTPRGEGVTEYQIIFGDLTVDSDFVTPGNSTKHTYAEGVYQVRIIATTISGKQTEVIQELTVSFVAPTNLMVNVANVPGNNLAITVSATASLETFFQVYFGENPNDAVDFMEGETITHTYANTGTFVVRVVAMSGGVAVTDYTQTVIISNPILLPVDFESSTLSYAFTSFGGANTSVVSNPDIGTGNSSAKVAKLNKIVGSEVYAGSFIELGAPIDFSTLNKIKLKVWSPESGITVKMKLENLLNPNINAEVDVTNTITNGWEELTFNFAGINTANNYQRVVVFFNFGNAGTGLDYYFDDIQLTSGAEVLVLPINFQSTTLPYTFTSFAGADTQVIDNPSPTGINTSTKVAAFTKGAAALTYAGSLLDLATPINFSGLQKIKMKVWSPQAGVVVKMKLEKLGNSAINVEEDATTTVANGWETLTYDFTGINNANNYQKLILFFDFGNIGTGTTYYFDDIIQSN